MHKHPIHDRQIIDVKSNKLGIERGINWIGNQTINEIEPYLVTFQHQ
jgi:hypothetical protein